MQIILENSVLSQVYQHLLRLFFLVGAFIYFFHWNYAAGVESEIINTFNI